MISDIQMRRSTSGINLSLTVTGRQQSIQLDKPGLVVILIALGYVVLSTFNLSPGWLVWLQQNDIYKELSGFLLAILVIQQWRLGRRYRTFPQQRERCRQWHMSLGTWSMLVFLLHSSQFGYGYQIPLAVAFLCNGLLGHLNPRSLKLRSPGYFTVWLTSHICLAMFISMLMAYHLYITYSY